jgi:hypothetical protein
LGKTKSITSFGQIYKIRKRSMTSIIKSFLKKTLGSINVFPTRMVQKDKMLSLMKKLYPLSTDNELIRLGPKGDGGYLVPNDLNGIYACFSPGVNLISGFENDCAELGIRTFLADKSIDKPARMHTMFKFIHKYIGAMSNDEFITLDNWVTSMIPKNDSDLLLQMDIEGFEYEVLLSVSDALMKRFRIIVAEFHHLDQLWSNPFFNVAARAFDKILLTHNCVHIHPNNCGPSLKLGGLDIPGTMEFTFYRSDRIKSSSYQTRFPNPLDFDNTKNQTLPLPKCWFSKP